jgi:hypothetical protein
MEVIMARLKLSRKTDEDITRPNDETAGEVLADGSILELVGDPVGTKQPRLLRWDGKNAIVGERFECDGKTYVPARLDSSVLKALRLPTRVVPIASTRELFTSVCKLFARFNDLPEQAIRQIAYFLFADWLSDCVWLAPFLSIVAPPTAPSWTLMRLLSLVCRHPILLGELSPGGFRKLLHVAQTYSVAGHSGAQSSFATTSTRVQQARNVRFQRGAAGGFVLPQGGLLARTVA